MSPIPTRVANGRANGSSDIGEATNGRRRRLEPGCKQPGVVDDVFGVGLDVEVTTGETNEGEQLPSRLDAVATATGADVATATADAGCAYARIVGGLERRGIVGVIPAKAEPIRSKVPMRRFRHDATHDIPKCPRGKGLGPSRAVKHGRFFHSRASIRARATAGPAILPRFACRRAV